MQHANPNLGGGCAVRTKEHGVRVYGSGFRC